ncbi:MAG: hypothetical protein F6K31_27875, partial [Symploca sp. SIO2G7]|nr:hypothetical protein [Symploca sp. SIO2G7]
ETRQQLICSSGNREERKKGRREEDLTKVSFLHRGRCAARRALLRNTMAEGNRQQLIWQQSTVNSQQKSFFHS